jgi:hypothetical protein
MFIEYILYTKYYFGSPRHNLLEFLLGSIPQLPGNSQVCLTQYKRDCLSPFSLSYSLPSLSLSPHSHTFLSMCSWLASTRLYTLSAPPTPVSLSLTLSLLPSQLPFPCPKWTLVYTIPVVWLLTQREGMSQHGPPEAPPSISPYHASTKHIPDFFLSFYKTQQQ